MVYLATSSKIPFHTTTVSGAKKTGFYWLKWWPGRGSHRFYLWKDGAWSLTLLSTLLGTNISPFKPALLSRWCSELPQVGWYLSSMEGIRTLLMYQKTWGSQGKYFWFSWRFIPLYLNLIIPPAPDITGSGNSCTCSQFRFLMAHEWCR